MTENDFIPWCSSLLDGSRISDTSACVGGLPVDYVDINNGDVVESMKDRGNASEDRLVVFSDEWLGKRDQWKASILSRIGRFSRRLGARECNVSIIPRHVARTFLDMHHVQGSNRLSVVVFGLICEEELVGVMSLGRHGRQISKNRIVLDRMCFKTGVQVVGGASRLFKRCIKWGKENSYDEILSFSDNRWSDGGIYKRLGFNLEKSYRPDYLYVKDGKRVSKQSQQKKKTNCPKEMTELQWATERGLVRIYDKGKKRWVFNLNPESHSTWSEKASEITAKQHQNGFFKHHHIRGEFRSEKNNSSVYYSSSYELRCVYMLEGDDLVKSFRRCDAFSVDGRWRNPDLWVDFVDGHSEVWEIKPSDMLSTESAQKQIADSISYAGRKNAGFKLWTEANSGLSGYGQIVDWARKYIAESTGDTSYIEIKKERDRVKRRRHYDKNIRGDKVEVECDFCNATHSVLRKSHDKNIERNGEYICERHGGHIAGKKPKDHLKKTNPYAPEGRKECSTCSEVRPIGGFGTRKASWDGLSSSCRECVSIKNKDAYENGKKEKMKAKRDAEKAERDAETAARLSS